MHIMTTLVIAKPVAPPKPAAPPEPAAAQGKGLRAGALNALGNFTSSDFIAVAVPLAALLGVLAVARGTAEAGGRPGNGHGNSGGKRHGQV